MKKTQEPSSWALKELQRRIGENKESYLAHMGWRATDEEKTRIWGDESWRKYEAMHKEKVSED